MAVPNALLDCWAVIEDYTDTMSLISASNTCTTLHNIVRIKCTALTIRSPALKISNALDNTSISVTTDDVPDLVRSIHFSALNDLTIESPYGTSGTEVATEIATKIEHAKNVRTYHMPMYFSNCDVLCLL